MSARFIMCGLVTTAATLLLHALAYFLLLKDFYRSHPSGSQEFLNQLYRGPNELIVWALAVTSLAMGFFITTVVKWSGATTLASGLKYGFIVAALYWASVNFGLYASSNFFSLASVLVDYGCSVSVMTISGAIAAWILGRGSLREGMGECQSQR